MHLTDNSSALPCFNKYFCFGLNRKTYFFIYIFNINIKINQYIRANIYYVCVGVYEYIINMLSALM